MAKGLSHGRRHEWRGERGMASVWVIGILALAGIVAGAALQVALLAQRSAEVEQARVRALDYAESGVAYAIAYLAQGAVSPDAVAACLPDGSSPSTVLGELSLGPGGGYRSLSVCRRGNGEYVIRVIGYAQGPIGREIARGLETVVSLGAGRSRPLFPRHWLWMLTGDPEKDKNNPINDPTDPAYGYVPVDVHVKPMPAWEMPVVSPVTCPAYGTRSRDVTTECRWPGTYSLAWDSSPAAIRGAKLHVTGDLNIDGSWRLNAADSVVRVDGRMSLGGASTTEFRNMTFFVGRHVDIGGSNDSKFYGDTAIYAQGNLTLGGAGRVEFFDGATFFVGGHMTLGGSGDLYFHGDVIAFVDGDLKIQGSGLMRFDGAATFYVNGSVKIQGSGWTRGAGGHDTPWITFYVKKEVEISGAAGAGSSVPDAVFLLDTDPAYDGYEVSLTGSASLYGGIYAPTRKIKVTGTSQVTGSLVGKTLDIPSWRSEAEFRDRYNRYAERMRSFYVTTEGRTRTSEYLLEWRELDPVQWR